MTWPALHLSITIARAPAEVAAFAGDPANLPLWATGLSSGIREEDGHWVTDSPMGRVEVAFTGPIEFGILDHSVTLPDGSVVHNPLRVLANGTGSEVVFTLYRRDGMRTQELYADADADAIFSDLAELKRRLEDEHATR